MDIIKAFIILCLALIIVKLFIDLIMFIVVGIKVAKKRKIENSHPISSLQI